MLKYADYKKILNWLSLMFNKAFICVEFKSLRGTSVIPSGAVVLSTASNWSAFDGLDAVSSSV